MDNGINDQMTQMTQDELASIGRKLYGDEWKAKLAREIGWSRYTLYRWANGKAAVHPSAAKHIRDLDRKHEGKEAQ